MLYAANENLDILTSFGQNGLFEDNMDSGDEAGMDDFIFHDGFAVLGGYMNNLIASNFTDLAFIAIEIDPAVAMKEISVPRVDVFPNPAVDRVTISSELYIEQVSIYDEKGQLISKFNPGRIKKVELNISDYPKGKFLIVCEISGSEFSTIIIKQ